MATKLSNKKSVMAIVKEAVEGTPISPTNSKEYIALQDGFDMEPAFSELENAELVASIGKAKTILGTEEPTASVNHYVRHSGVEGVEPAYGLMFESLLGGKTIVAIERDSVASTTGDESNRGTVDVDAGEGVEYERGVALLIKDASNGYQIRNVYDVVGDQLILGQNLLNAPANGTNLGKAIAYKPADELHPTLAMWLYRANGGAVEMMQGGRVTEGSIEVTAGEFVNGSFTVAGIGYSFDPVEINSSNKNINFNDGGLDVNIDVAEKFYKDPHQLADAIQVAMQSLTSDVITVSYDDSTGKYTVASDGVTLELNWTAANSIGLAIGYDTGADDTGATSYVGDTPLDLSSPQNPDFDSANPLVAKNNEVMIGDFHDVDCFEASTLTASVSGSKADIPSICAETGKSGSIISEREVEVEVSSLLSKYNADKFKRYREGENIQFTFNFGEKSGGNWVAGKCANLYMPTATISSFKLEDADGLVQLSMTLKGYVDDGKGEFYINLI